MEAGNYKLDLENQEKFSLVDEPEVEQFVVGFDEPDDLDVDFGDIVNNGTNDFNALYNRPSYGGNVMTGETNIPEVIQYEAGENIQINGRVISALINVDNKLSPTSTNPVQNRVIYADLATKVDAAELAPVAFTGEYDDLENEPGGFTPDEWNSLWKKY